MFGDKKLIGFDKVKINNYEYRLPTYTCALVKEKLYYFKYTKYICLMNEKKLKSNLNTLLSNIKKDYDYEYYNKFVRKLFGKMLTFEIVNNKGQILLPNKWDDISFKDYIYIEGCIDHLKIFSNIKDYNDYILKKTT